jgi:cardiolipin synthase A/B
MLVDGATAYTMTCNLTQSALGGSASATNREYAIVDTHAEDTAAVAAIFQADWHRTQPVVNDVNLVVSPTNSSAKLTSLIDSARTTLMIKQEEMDDPSIEDRRIAAAQRGVVVSVTLASFADSASSPIRRL